MTTKILLYEDNADLRNSLKELLRFSNDFELLAAFENCMDIAKHIQSYSPDIVLMDIDMPVVNGIEGLKIIRSINEELPVLMLTVFDDNEHILTAIKEGATGYILKQNLTHSLGAAIEDAINGGAPMTPAVAKLVLKHLSNPRSKWKDYGLTPREKDVLRSLTEGNSYKMIADKENIAIGTVTTHIRKIYEKLGVHSQAEAVKKSMEERIF